MPGHNFHERQVKRLVIGVTGRIGAGKTSASKYLSSVHGFHYIRYSQVLSDWLARDPDSKRHLQVVGWEVMAGGMQAELNTRLITQIPAGIDCAVDGLRHPIDFESLGSSFPSRFFLLYMDCPQEIRWQRLRSRFPNLGDFADIDSHPVEQNIGNLRPKAIAVINNNGSLQDLYLKVDVQLTKIRQGGQE